MKMTTTTGTSRNTNTPEYETVCWRSTRSFAFTIVSVVDAASKTQEVTSYHSSPRYLPRTRHGKIYRHTKIYSHSFTCLFFHSVSHEVSESVSESVNESVSQSVNRLINRSVNRSINRSVNRSINRLVNRSINQSVNWSINRSINRSSTSVDRSARQLSFTSSLFVPLYVRRLFVLSFVPAFIDSVVWSELLNACIHTHSQRAWGGHKDMHTDYINASMILDKATGTKRQTAKERKTSKHNYYALLMMIYSFYWQNNRSTYRNSTTVNVNEM